MSYDYTRGLNYALYLLSLQMRTAHEVRDKLLSKEMSEEMVEQIISYLSEHHFLDDVVYAQSYVRSRRHKFGDYRIKADLKRKGVSAEDIQKGYAALADEEETEDAPEDNNYIQRVLDKKIAATTIDWDRLKTDYKYKYSLYQKLARFLASRGFSGDVIKNVISERLAEEFIDET